MATLSAERRAAVAEVAPNVPLVDAFPAFAGAIGDALGRLWIAEFERPEEEYTDDLDSNTRIKAHDIDRGFHARDETNQSPQSSCQTITDAT